MKLIETLIMASQEFGIYGDWTAQHGQEAHITLWESQYTPHLGNDLVGQSERLESVIACLAEKAAHLIASEHWQISRSIGTPEHHSRYLDKLAIEGAKNYRREFYGDFKR